LITERCIEGPKFRRKTIFTFWHQEEYCCTHGRYVLYTDDSECQL